MLELLRNDRIKDAYEYYDINVEEERRRLDKMEAESDSEKNKEEFKVRYAKCKARIEFADRMKIDCHKNKATVPSTTSIQLFSEFAKFLYSCTQNKCPYLNCKR